MATSPIAATTGASAADYYADTQSRIPIKTLDQQDFLKLLVAQMSAQDPMSPKSDTDFIGQMAQFTSLEQTKGMEANLSALRSQQDLLQANSMIGRQVALQADANTVVTGVVSSVNVEAGTPKLVVNGTAYALDSVLSLAPVVAETQQA